MIGTTLTAAKDEAKLFADAREMRDRLAAQFRAKTCWDLKYARGGLIDLEFIAQTLQLHAAPEAPDVLDTNTIAALGKLEKADALAPDAAADLIAAAKLQGDLMQVLRIALDGPLDPHAATPGLKALLVRAGGASDFAALEARLTAAQARVRELYEAIMNPASAA